MSSLIWWCVHVYKLSTADLLQHLISFGWAVNLARIAVRRRWIQHCVDIPNKTEIHEYTLYLVTFTLWFMEKCHGSTHDECSSYNVVVFAIYHHHVIYLNKYIQYTYIPWSLWFATFFVLLHWFQAPIIWSQSGIHILCTTDSFTFRPPVIQNYTFSWS